MSGFGAETTETETTETTETTESTTTNELPEDIRKKIEHQDQHIQTLEAEAKERDEKIIQLLESQAEKDDKSMAAEDIKALVETLKTSRQEPVQEPPSQQEVSIDEITSAVGDKLKEQALKDKQEANLQAAMDAAKEAYGDDFETKVVELAKSKSMSLEALNNMAANNPAVFNELFLPVVEKKPATLTTSTDTTAGLEGEAPPKPKPFLNLPSKQRAKRVADLMESLANQ